MSSVYRILCLSHDPAIAFGGVEERGVEWNAPEPALEAIRYRNNGAAEAHPHCDLIVGRYSAPLIEVCCPAGRSNDPHHGSSHRGDLWIDASWLRLLALAKPEHVTAARLRSCWGRELAWGLRYELDLENA